MREVTVGEWLALAQSLYVTMFILPAVTGREWSDWSSELRIPGDELKWKFISDGSVNGWGWRFTVYPIMPAAGKLITFS